jgi:tRNA(Ile)-lysidine synthase
LHAESAGRGLILHVAHLHHGLRGEEADADLGFVQNLAAQLGLPFHEHRVDTGAESKARTGKPAETVEEAARRLRYGWLRSLMSDSIVDAVATAHTRDDQAETVLAKLLRGAWTEGLSGIHPVVQCEPGRIVRPLLNATRSEIEAYLRSLAQPWREDSTNKHLTYTRNRIRHELLPSLEAWNPRLREHLANIAELARDEQEYWAAQIPRIAAALILPGRPVRGGGRAAASDIALDINRLSELPPALQRRVLRFAAAKLGAAPDFPSTDSLRNLALYGRAGQKSELSGGLRAERTHRELRLSIQPVRASEPLSETGSPVEIPLALPGETAVPAFGLTVRIDLAPSPGSPGQAVLRPWKPGDRVRLQYSSGERKVKEVLERMKVTGAERAQWPVIALDGKIVWMLGVKVDPLPGLTIAVAGSDA